MMMIISQIKTPQMRRTRLGIIEKHYLIEQLAKKFYKLQGYDFPRRKTPTLRSTPLTQPTFERRDINANEGVDLNVRVHCNPLIRACKIPRILMNCSVWQWLEQQLKSLKLMISLGEWGNECIYSRQPEG